MKHSTWMGALVLTAMAGLATAQAPSPKKAENEVKSMDQNGDGKISPEEHAAGAKRMFEAIDANQDGKATAREMDAARARVTGTQAVPGEMSSAEKIKVIDTDGDGVLTAAEHAAGSKRMFLEMDSNHDGFVTLEELSAGHARMMKKPAN